MPDFCTNCGESIQPGMKFCVNCGTSVEAAPSPIVSPAAPPGAPPPNLAPPRRPVAVSGKTVALYDEDAPSAPPYPRQEQPAFAPKKQAVYPQQNMDSAYSPRPGPYPSAMAPPMPPPGRQGLGATGYLVNLVVMSLPVFGLVMAILWQKNTDTPDKSNLAKAMIVFNVIWYIVFFIFMFALFSLLSEAVDISFKWGF